MITQDYIEDEPQQVLARDLPIVKFLGVMEERTSTFEGYIRSVNPNYKFYDHCQTMVNVLERVVSGELTRVMLFLPPRHGKTEVASRLFPGYYLSRHLGHSVGLCSYAAELAFSISRDAKERYEMTGRHLASDVQSVKEWHTAEGGRFWSAGVGGPITGRGFNLGVVDDPVKNREEAWSVTTRESVWQWWTTVFYTRQEPGARIVLIMTRWHEDDLAGRILAQASEPWHVVNMPAVKDSVSITMPQGWSLEEDNRSDGEALCPLRYNEEQLEVIRATVGATTWQALFQQRPTNQEGNLWKRSWFENATFETAPELVNVGYDWDTAYTEDDDNSATAYFKSGIGQDGRIYILDFDFRWTEFPETITWMKGLQGPHYVEKKASGKSIVPMLRKVEVYAAEVPVKGGDKIARTMIATPIVETGRVRFKGSILSRLLDDERQGLLKFPVGSHNDVNDAFVQALNRLYPFTKITVGEHKEKEWWEEVGGAPTNGNGNGSRPPSDWRNAFVV